MATYDAIVIGLGAMGSAAAYALTRRGHRVLGLDAFAPGHTLGASHGRSRIIREAYFEASEYVPLVQRAYRLWRELEEVTGSSLLTITGGIAIGPPECDLVTGAMENSRRHALPYEFLTAREIHARYPGFHPTDDLVGVVEPNAGVLAAEACLAALRDGAAAAGADLHFAEPVIAWFRDGDGVAVQTDGGVYRSQYLVLTPGAWAARLLPELALPLVVHRIVNTHFAPRNPEPYQPERCPVHLWAVPEGQFYGFPVLPGQGLKLGRHDVDDACTPETMRRDVGEDEIAELRQMLDRYLPGAGGPVLWTVTCTYTHSPDRHFIIDRHPEHAMVAFGCGFSGHGFKFAPVIGEALADLATGNTPAAGIAFFAASRFATTTGA